MILVSKVSFKAGKLIGGEASICLNAGVAKLQLQQLGCKAL